MGRSSAPFGVSWTLRGGSWMPLGSHGGFGLDLGKVLGWCRDGFRRILGEFGKDFSNDFLSWDPRASSSAPPAERHNFNANAPSRDGICKYQYCQRPCHKNRISNPRWSSCWWEFVNRRFHFPHSRPRHRPRSPALSGPACYTNHGLRQTLSSLLDYFSKVHLGFPPLRAVRIAKNSFLRPKTNLWFLLFFSTFWGSSCS